MRRGGRQYQKIQIPEPADARVRLISRNPRNRRTEGRRREECGRETGSEQTEKETEWEEEEEA